jgi:hypothetical protein
MSTLLVVAIAVSAVMALGYLAACAGAGRWLSLREWM